MQRTPHASSRRAINRSACVEGVIDLLVVDEPRNRCLLVDWKTNCVQKAGQEALRHRYKPQIAAYWKAVSEITKLKVDAGIFATAIGKFLPYEEAELEAEWERLSKLPADEFSVAASRWDAPGSN